jgi:hypothetical protein
MINPIEKSAKVIAKKILPNRFIRLVKCVINPMSIVDVRKNTNNPIEASYLAKHNFFIIEAEIEKCRTFFYTGYIYSRKSLNPAVNFLIDYQNIGDRQYKNSSL